MRRGFSGLAAAAAVLWLQACATVPGGPALTPELSTDCQRWWQALDAAVLSTGTADAEAVPIDGFPGLRATRITDALRSEARQTPAAFEAWIQHAAREDIAARGVEINNLPVSAFPLADAPDRAAARTRSNTCRDAGLQTVRVRPELQAALLARPHVPARYSLLKRGLGLYPVLRWPFYGGVAQWQAGHQAAMQRWQTEPPPLHYWHPPGPAATDADPWPDTRDALGLPQWQTADVQRWLHRYAPVIAVHTQTASDHFGTPFWPPGAAAPAVDTAEPVVYQRFSTTRMAGRWLPQLVYTLWFPERPARHALDPLAGALDGVIVRLTLSEAGQPLLLDTIHACGCYHLFFAAPSLQARPGAPQHEEWLFAPAPLPALTAGQRLVVYLSSGSHSVMGLGLTSSAPADGDARYALAPEEQLRSLPAVHPNANPRSLYGPDGLVAGTQRGERWFFWPMGISSAGAMRQWGHHATAFVGRRHFDEADLLHDRFSPPVP